MANVLIKQVLTKHYETKHKVRYSEPGTIDGSDSPIGIGSVYIPKKHFEGREVPGSVFVEVRDGE